MPVISPAEVLHVASLAKLRLDDGEIRTMSEQLTSILDHMDALAAVNVEGVEPFSAASETAAPLRDESATPDALEVPPSEIAPRWEDGFFVVPRVAALDADALVAEEEL
jgi:aspartyl-tRNA(Asn)/glutamyl-tRNA(Gln) amidotransferase subunit C